MIKLNDRVWKSFRLGDLFEIKGGYYQSRPSSESEDGIPYISSSENNNAVNRRLVEEDLAFVDRDGKPSNTMDGKIYGPNTMTMAMSGSVGNVFFHEYRHTMYSRVSSMIPRFEINKYIGLFLKVVIETEKFKYSYGRIQNMKRLKGTEIKLPVKVDGQPDWQFMEDYIKQFEETKLLEIQETDYKDNVTLPSVDEWGGFRLDELFTISRGRLAKKPSDIGEVPYISSSGMNNGLNESFNIDCKYIVRADLSPVITVANNGSVGSTFVQEFAFSASSDVSILEPIFDSNTDALFFVKVVIERNKNLYGYGRKWGLEKMRSSIIKLPALENGEPDWILMERYMRSLPYSEMI